MKIKTEDGIAEPMPLSDLQQNNILTKELLEEQKKVNKNIRFLYGSILIVGGGFLLLSLYVLNQIMKWNILTNYINACVGV